MDVPAALEKIFSANKLGHCHSCFSAIIFIISPFFEKNNAKLVRKQAGNKMMKSNKCKTILGLKLLKLGKDSAIFAFREEAGFLFFEPHSPNKAHFLYLFFDNNK